MRRWLVVLLTLPALALWLRAADPPADPARAAFERGNALLRQARQSSAPQELDLLRQAAREYRDCLASPAGTLESRELFAAARYNLELANLLSAQATRPQNANGSGDKQSGAGDAAKEKGRKEGGPGDQMAPGNKQEAATKPDAAKTPKGAEPKTEEPNEGASDLAQAAGDALAQLMEEPEPLVYDSQCPT
jgi:hypothetical protein